MFHCYQFVVMTGLSTPASTVITNSLAILPDHEQIGTTHKVQGNAMQRYTIITPLVAIRLCGPDNDTDKAGMTFLPADAIVETHGPSSLGRGMIEVSSDNRRYAVFERDLLDRATVGETARV